MNAATLLQYTVSGLMPTLTATLAGSYLAKKNIFTKHVVAKITSAFVYHLVPIFLLFSIAGSITFHEFGTIWPLFLSPLLIVILGRLISLLHYMLFTQIPHFSRIIACMIIFPNMGSIPLVLMKGMCSPYGPLKGNKYCSESNSYVSLQMFTFMVIIWSYGFSLIAQDKQEYENHKEKQQLLQQGEVVIASPQFSMWRSTLKNLLQPSPLASILGLIIGLIPGVQETFYDKTSFVYALLMRT